jgi:hypothetical protein
MTMVGVVSRSLASTAAIAAVIAGSRGCIIELERISGMGRARASEEPASRAT